MYKLAEDRRAAWRRYYDRKTTEFRRRRKEKKKTLQEFVASLKKGPCADCGHSFPPCAMDFDHVRGKKKFSIAVIAAGAGGYPMLLKEIKKCELVCANCHRIRTHRRLSAVTRVS